MVCQECFEAEYIITRKAVFWFLDCAVDISSFEIVLAKNGCSAFLRLSYKDC